MENKNKPEPEKTEKGLGQITHPDKPDSSDSKEDNSQESQSSQDSNTDKK